MDRPASIICLDLKTKQQRKISKADKIRAEIERLKRANTYIKDEPACVAYTERNTLRIESLIQQLKVIETREG